MKIKRCFSFTLMGVGLLSAGLLGCREKADEKKDPDDPTKSVLFTGKLRARTDPQLEFLHSVAISPDGKFAVTGGQHLRFWNTGDAKEVRKARVIPAEDRLGRVTGLLYFPDGKQVAGFAQVTRQPLQIRFWDPESCKEV